MMVMREAPAEFSTVSSESEFMTVSVCDTPMTSAKGRMIGMTEGMIRVASFRKAKIDWPLSVTRLTLASACVTQTMPSKGTSVATNMSDARRRI
jgi:hypothetical protein